MSIVAWADFETLSVRVSLFDRDKGRLGSEIAEYPLDLPEALAARLGHVSHKLREVALQTQSAEIQ